MSRKKIIDEFYATVTPDVLAAMPKVEFDSKPFRLNTHDIAEAGWNLRIVSEKKIRRYYALGRYYNRPYEESTRVTFYAGVMSPSKTHSVIHLKFPFFVKSVNELFLAMLNPHMGEVGSGESVSDYISTIGMKLKCRELTDIERMMKDDDEQLTNNVVINNTSERVPAILTADEAIEKFGLTSILEAYNRKNTHLLKKKKPKQLPPPSNVVNIEDFREPKKPDILTPDDIQKMFGKVI